MPRDAFAQMGHSQAFKGGGWPWIEALIPRALIAPFFLSLLNKEDKP